MSVLENGAANARLLPNLDQLMELAGERATAYQAGDPFPHGVFDGVFDPDLLRQVAAELPSHAEDGWTTWDTVDEWKHVFDQPEHFGPAARRLAEELNSSEFVRFLERLTGIDALVPDPHLTAAGYFDVERGGFLNVHIDFARNPKLGLARRVNVLVYLNENWDPSWGGSLELWRTLDDGPVVEIVPELNRMAIFTTPNAPHGHPKPITCPPGRSRQCFSAYYFTSPDREDSPSETHGVLWSTAKATTTAGRVASLGKHLAPPILVDALKAARRSVRRRRAGV